MTFRISQFLFMLSQRLRTYFSHSLTVVFMLIQFKLKPVLNLGWRWINHRYTILMGDLTLFYIMYYSFFIIFLIVMQIFLFLIYAFTFGSILYCSELGLIESNFALREQGILPGDGREAIANLIRTRLVQDPDEIFQLVTDNYSWGERFVGSDEQSKNCIMICHLNTNSVPQTLVGLRTLAGDEFHWYLQGHLSANEINVDYIASNRLIPNVRAYSVPITQLNQTNRNHLEVMQVEQDVVHLIHLQRLDLD